MVNDVVFITDTHFMRTARVRTGDFLEDCAVKLQWVQEYCNTNKCVLVHGGDLFNTPSVPDEVKNRIFPIIAGFKYGFYAIPGNHSILYNSYDYMHKTSYQTLVSTGLITDFTNQTLDMGDWILTNQKPVITRGKPQIGVFHGFLNQEDDNWTFNFQDITSTDPLYVCLGHDHVKYEPICWMSNTKIFRPGSFVRQTRQEESFRQPEILHIRFRNGKLVHKDIPIGTARHYDEIFNAKEVVISKAQQQGAYDAIIAQIRNASAGDTTFPQALSQVASEPVQQFAMKLLTEYRIESQSKRQNL